MPEPSGIGPYASLRWRCIGPYRGGRSSAVCGDPADPQVYYFGACAGGVWKTTDAGITWTNVSDGFLQTASVGAIAVAPADGNVIYAGMGESNIRGNVTFGDGVYRSTDAGATWRHLGLGETRSIARVRVHPADPDHVFVAALGNIYGPSAERGVFRSRDGGRTWDKVLYGGPDAGCIDLVMDPRNPRILYAALWQVRRSEWHLESGGPASGLWKSVDGGDTWTDLTRNPGLPEGPIGRIGLAASGAKPGRVWACVESEAGGIFRSDDGGSSWQRTSEDRNLRTRAFYYSNLYADPQDADTVWGVNNLLLKSIDGGRTFTAVPTPHGDHHDLWQAPDDPRRMILGCDGGGCVSFNGGGSWSTIYNQPTAEFYHVTTDTRFPYRVYGSQQDNTTLCVPSRSLQAAITERQWYPVGGGESAYIAVRPDNPDIVFASSDGGGQGGKLTRYDHALGQFRDVSPWPERTAGLAAAEYTHRFQWTSPVLISPHDPDTLYMCGNRVFRSADEGGSWEVISPDLTRNDSNKMQASGGLTNDHTGVEVYCTIFAFAESPVQKGLLWAGSDDGLLHLSRDGGANWENVTPAALPEWTRIAIVEPSPFDAGTAYIAGTRYRLDDPAPYLFKTEDYGKTWTAIAAGLPAGEPSRVIRADPVRRGLLFCGTELGVYASLDDGRTWQELRLNLPVVAVHDLAVKDGDLVAGTHGRSFWICDGAAALLRQAATPESSQLFAPAPAVRLVGGGGRMFLRDLKIEAPAAMMMMGETLHYLRRKPEGGEAAVFADAGQNPPAGAVLHYYLATAPQAALQLTIRELGGKVVRTFTSKPEGDDPALPAETGANRFIWDMRYPEATRMDGAPPSEARGPGPLALPGTYAVELTVDGTTLSQRLEIVKDPRIAATDADLAAQFELHTKIRDKLSQVNEAINRIETMRRQVQEWVRRAEGQAEVGERAKALQDQLDGVEDELVQRAVQGGQDFIVRTPKLNNRIAYMTGVLTMADFAPTRQAQESFAKLAEEADAQLDRLEGIVGRDVRAFSNYVRELGIAPVRPA